METNFKKERIGEVGYTKRGDRYKIIEYKNASNIIIQFEDGTTRRTTYSNMINKIVLHPNLYKNRVGESKINNQGLRMEIIKYNNCDSVDILFENGDIINKSYEVFKSNKVRSLIHPKVKGVGFLGYGKYVSVIKGKETIPYHKWSSMLARCYGKKRQINHPSYEGCSVCEDWHNFQNFAKWYEENIWDENINFQLDKDILIKGNKIYSPKTCILVDGKINTLFINNKARRGDYPVGVRLKKNKYDVGCSVECEDGTRHIKHIGLYTTPIDAFNAYKLFKESYIKQVADKYKSKYPNFPKKLYDAMYKYKIEITD